ncbi:MAG: hypothetical protein AAFY26_21800, partial [Cyanobacteria bacterium J06638_22]
MREAFGDQLRVTNAHLEKCGLRVKGGKVYLRSRHFPPKPGHVPGKQYELAMGVSASPAGLKVAIAKAKAIDSDLMWGRFSWKHHLRGKAAIPETIAQWVERYEEHHW